jgi:hypothetical protein
MGPANFDLEWPAFKPHVADLTVIDLVSRIDALSRKDDARGAWTRSWIKRNRLDDDGRVRMNLKRFFARLQKAEDLPTADAHKRHRCVFLRMRTEFRAALDGVIDRDQDITDLYILLCWVDGESFETIAKDLRGPSGDGMTRQNVDQRAFEAVRTSARNAFLTFTLEPAKRHRAIATAQRAVERAEAELSRARAELASAEGGDVGLAPIFASGGMTLFELQGRPEDVAAAVVKRRPAPKRENDSKRARPT